MSAVTQSFTSASTFPVKAALHRGAVNRFGQIRPVHAQILPTNACNLRCSFCSCKDRNTDEELEIDALTKCLRDLRYLGCEAITITGGGEPTLYRHLAELVHTAVGSLSIHAGMVTNGLLLHKVDPSCLSKLTWCRISCSDDRWHHFDTLADVIDKIRTVDWAFSYVISKSPDWDKLEQVLRFANEHNMTHVRVVPNLLDVHDTGPVMAETRLEMVKRRVPLSRAVFQARDNAARGTICRVGLLKPVIAPDGYVYPCCGVQYAMNGKPKAMLEQFRLCKMQDIRVWSAVQEPFNGSVCDNCYYSAYNEFLAAVPHVKHERFV